MWLRQGGWTLGPKSLRKWAAVWSCQPERAEEGFQTESKLARWSLGLMGRVCISIKIQEQVRERSKKIADFIFRAPQARSLAHTHAHVRGTWV